VLAGTATLLGGAFAGCAHPAGGLQMRAVDDAELAAAASRNFSEAPPPIRELVGDAVTDSATVEDTAPPVETDLPVVRDGRYYKLSRTVVKERSVTVYDVEIDYDPADASGDAVAYADLPAADRAAVDELLPPRDGEGEGYERGAGVRYTDAEAANSTLVGSETLVAVDGVRHRVRAGDPHEMTVETYRYTAERVADTAEGYATHLRERYLLSFDDLPERERSLLETAIEEGYYAESPDAAAFEAVVERLFARPAVTRTEYVGNWLVRYRNTTYWVDLRAGQFVEN
jgi:hypothetical protein